MISSLPLPLVSELDADAPAAPDLTVVLVSHNTCNLLDACLESLDAGLGGRSSEVWVVDNASRDGSADRVRASHPGVRLIENRENVGFARACNQALRLARGKYLLLLNPDCLVPPGALDRLATVLDEHPEAAVCGPLLWNADGSPQPSWARFSNLTSEISGRLDRSQSPYPLPDFADASRRTAMRPFAVDWVGGACFLVRAEAARAVGLLDERFFLYGEEADWCHRFGRADWKVLLAPTVTVTHRGGASGEALPNGVRRCYPSAPQRRAICFLVRVAAGPHLGSREPALAPTGRYRRPAALTPAARRLSFVCPRPRPGPPRTRARGP